MKTFKLYFSEARVPSVVAFIETNRKERREKLPLPSFSSLVNMNQILEQRYVDKGKLFALIASLFVPGTFSVEASCAFMSYKYHHLPTPNIPR